MWSSFYGGKGGIRTLGTIAGTTVFKTVTLNHSVTFPWFSLLSVANLPLVVESLSG